MRDLFSIVACGKEHLTNTKTLVHSEGKYVEFGTFFYIFISLNVVPFILYLHYTKSIHPSIPLGEVRYTPEKILQLITGLESNKRTHLALTGGPWRT